MTFSKILIFTVIAFSNVSMLSAQEDTYLVGGTSDWTDLDKWYDDAAGTIPTVSGRIQIVLFVLLISLVTLCLGVLD
ncbi:MAG: hypothetical protein ACJA1A_003213 [Saprospiraceae bacterium]|jgi:hypothetical protein|tara:strand:- start:730 stop:960 length:231 start_codon:yes stop_codon:yes gene_type:complete